MDKELIQRGVSTALRWWKSMYASAGELKKRVFRLHQPLGKLN